MSADPVPACVDRLSGGSFVEPTNKDLREREPCRYCFPDGEIDVADDELLVGEARQSRGRLHRHERTGELDWDHRGGQKLAYALRDPDVSDPAEAWSRFQGGDA